MKRALVTGATGFIGPHLVRRLVNHGTSVRCLVRESSDLSQLRPLEPEFVFADVMNAESLISAIDGCDVVYHIAGLTKSVPAQLMWDVNEQGVRNVAQVCAQMDTPPLLIVLSSLAAAGPASRDRPLRESDTPKPVSKYGLSKLKGEHAAFEFASQVPISIVRAPIVFGEGDLDGLALFTCIAKTRFHMVPTLRNYRYSFIHADDLSNAMILVAAKGKRLCKRHSDEGIYFAASEINPTYADYGRMLGQAMGGRPVIPWPNLATTIWIVGACSEIYARVSGRAQIMNWDKTREALAGSWACSADRLSEQTGYRTEASMADRLSQTVAWYVENGHLPAKMGSSSASINETSAKVTAAE